MPTTRNTTPRRRTTKPTLTMADVEEEFDVVYLDKVTLQPAKPVAIVYKGVVIKSRSPQSMDWKDVTSVDFTNGIDAAQALVTNPDALDNFTLTEVIEIGLRIVARYQQSGTPEPGESGASSES